MAMLKFINGLAESPCLSCLETLEIKSHESNESFILELAKVLPSMTKLNFLCIGSYNLGPAGMLKIIQALNSSPCLPYLRGLEISGNNAGDDGILELARLIPKMTLLSKISIKTNNCGSHAVLEMTEALSQSKKLTHFAIPYYSVDIETMKKIVVLLCKIKTLQEILLTSITRSKFYPQLIGFIRGNFPDLLKILREDPFHY